jgi:type III secretion protein Q
LGSTCIDAAALRDLGTGDVVWIDTARPSRTGLLAQLLTPAGNPGWTCRLRRESLHIVAASGGASQGDRAYWRAPMMKADGSSLEVPVTFDLGELQVPLQQLEQLQPGRLFELSQQAGEATVYLRVSGKLVAEGRMVTIGKRIGVRIAKVRMEGRG